MIVVEAKVDPPESAVLPGDEPDLGQGVVIVLVVAAQHDLAVGGIDDAASLVRMEGGGGAGGCICGAGRQGQGPGEEPGDEQDG